MRSIDELQKEIIQDFNELGDSFDQYAFLIELACRHRPLPEEEKTPECLVEGCQSQVWVKTYIRDGLFFFSSDSNTLIIKGILYLLEHLLNGHTCGEVAEAELTFLKETAMMDTFESDRQKGIGYVIKTLQETAGQNKMSVDIVPSYA